MTTATPTRALLINGVEIAATHFAWDQCHKIYLINSQEHRQAMFDNGWSESDIFPVEELPQAWENSCGLRFIEWADLSLPGVVPQFADQDTGTPTVITLTDNTKETDMTITYTDPAVVKDTAVDVVYPANPYASGYGPKIPTRYRVKYGDNRWRRVYVMQYGNAGSAYILKEGKELFIDSTTEYRLQGET